MRLVFAGTPDVACTALDALMDSRHTVVGVITRPDAARGRGRTMSMSPVARRAAELKIPVLQPTRLTDRSVADDLRALAPDCCPIVAYGGLVPRQLLDAPARTGGSTCTSPCSRRGAAQHQCSTPSCTATRSPALQRFD